MKRGKGKSTRMTVPEVAQTLGITPETVRERIYRKQLSAVKESNRWYVSLTAADRAAAYRGVIETPSEVSQTAPINLDLPQLNLIRDEWLQPLITRIEELAYENGQSHAEIRHLAAERDELKQTSVGRWRFWRR